MRSHSITPSARSKDHIQDLLREIALLRDGGCVFRGKEIGGQLHQCSSNATKDGHLVLQYDHLNPRSYNVSFYNLDLGVIICQGLHGWKKWHKEEYDAAVKKLIGKKRTALWERIAADKKAYPMSAWDWAKVELALQSDLHALTNEVKAA